MCMMHVHHGDAKMVSPRMLNMVANIVWSGGEISDFICHQSIVMHSSCTNRLLKK
jgi:hypothetical protein